MFFGILLARLHFYGGHSDPVGLFVLVVAIGIYWLVKRFKSDS